ncbi:hypothetical protein [Geomonas subterranea]|uniref:Lipoprotein n=1 Tax=Geomonas subterranea TaxID=2847989 RepID=A0ABX8LNA7_9BACT|nr:MULTISPECIES: hypothetical protein [Geomonas]QXE92114.1 hypothetical protein KP001_06185 [Geomonas subterranea]QXM09790.1 hypothetical protein KP002_01310 [Geomonas subterranea]
MRLYFLLVTLLAVSQTLSGCIVKTTLKPIDDDLKPVVKLTGKVHLRPLVDVARTPKLEDGTYLLTTGTMQTDHVSTNPPADVVKETISKCLTQSGLVLTVGENVPSDSDLVIDSSLTKVYVGTHDPYWALSTAVAAMTGAFTSSSNPRAFLSIANRFENRQSGTVEEAVFDDADFSIHHFTKSSGAARAFRLVEEKYCSWLQRKVAGVTVNQPKVGQASQ